MAFHFPLMPRLFMAMHMEDRFPIIDILEQTPADPRRLPVGAVPAQPRRADAGDGHRRGARLHVPRLRARPRRRGSTWASAAGWRRCWATTAARIELMNALLFSLPGTPVLYYGDEIGMGDNIYLGDRNGVRTPMQWSADRNAGFSRANPQRLYLPVIIDPEYHYEAVNVEAQQNNPHSLLWWMKRLIALRKRYQAFGRGTHRVPAPRATARCWRSCAQLRGRDASWSWPTCRASCSTSSSTCRAFTGMRPGRAVRPHAVPADRRAALPAHARAARLLLVRADAGRRQGSTHAAARVGAGSQRCRRSHVRPATGEQLVRGAGAAALEAALCRRAARAALVRRQGAHRSKAVAARRRAARSADDAGRRYRRAGRGRVTRAASRRPTRCRCAFVPASGRRPTQRDRPRRSLAELEVDRARGADHGRAASTPAASPAFGPRCSTPIAPATARSPRRAARRRRPTTQPFARLRDEPGHAAAPRSSAASRATPRSRFGDRLILKLFRRAEEGVNPDLEIGRFLTDDGRLRARRRRCWARSSTRAARGEPITLAVLQGFVPNEGDAWRYTLDQRRALLRGGAARRAPTSAPPPCRRPVLRADRPGAARRSCAS